MCTILLWIGWLTCLIGYNVLLLVLLGFVIIIIIIFLNIAFKK